ncbi:MULTISPECIES: hypothetical protein [unclassified Streptomyces]|uniref:hypothetical protein n=1 Tax=unclassified Streptomyces TaxID=2593676 RepID=UPI00236638BB|nr:MULTISPECIES: hypothetical protein [unclassified Streptomyces]MDF3141829.1 hypothetical protein [Streptomyces sp. T21Q-yed]WDF41378.1 hypothetical protein PBV52_33600 [Streptomyces sp. T12]
MSRYVSIKFEFADRLSIPDLIGSLVQGGWKLDDGGIISYLVESDMTDWENKGVGADLVVIEEMELARQSHGACAVILTWQATGVGGSFLVLSAGQRLSLDPRVDTVYRRDADGYVDFEWYLARILPAIDALGLTGYTVSDLPS